MAGTAGLCHIVNLVGVTTYTIQPPINPQLTRESSSKTKNYYYCQVRNEESENAIQRDSSWGVLLTTKQSYFLQNAQTILQTNLQLSITTLPQHTHIE